MIIKKYKKHLLIGAICSTIIFTGVSYIIGKIVYTSSIGSSPQVKTEDMVEVYSNKDGVNLIDKLQEYTSLQSFVTSEKNGYDIQTLTIYANEKTDNTMILVHGIQGNYYELLKYAFKYIDEGFNVVLYNQRNTGLTGGDTYTFGMHEKFDMDSVVKETKKLFPNGTLGVQGFSMGAATSAMHSKLNEEHKLVDYYILDSPYSEMKDSIMLGIETVDIPLIPSSYIRLCGDIYTKFKEGFSYSDVRPMEEVTNISTPMLLIHGTADEICDTNSSKKIFDAIPHNNKELWLVDGASHIQSFDANQDAYVSKVMSFINKYSSL